jgi:hypothetical protein
MPKFPEWIQPMAATLTQERFTGPDWIFERKFDGIRLLAYKKGVPLGASRDRCPSRLHPMDEVRKAAPSKAARRANG